MSRDELNTRYCLHLRAARRGNEIDEGGKHKHASKWCKKDIVHPMYDTDVDLLHTLYEGSLFINLSFGYSRVFCSSYA